jgi:hypothetical protein
MTPQRINGRLDAPKPFGEVAVTAPVVTMVPIADALRDIMTQDVRWTLPGDNAILGPPPGSMRSSRAQLIASYDLTFTLEHVPFSRDK